MFKPILPLLILCDAHSIITESHLYFLNGFHLAVTQFLAKFVAVALLLHFPYNENLTRALNNTSLKCCLASTDAIDRWKKNSCMHMKVQGCLMQVHFIEIHWVFTKNNLKYATAHQRRSFINLHLVVICIC
jgi:hypothetical protein